MSRVWDTFTADVDLAPDEISAAIASEADEFMRRLEEGDAAYGYFLCDYLGFGRYNFVCYWSLGGGAIRLFEEDPGRDICISRETWAVQEVEGGPKIVGYKKLYRPELSEAERNAWIATTLTEDPGAELNDVEHLQARKLKDILVFI